MEAARDFERGIVVFGLKAVSRRTDSAIRAQKIKSILHRAALLVFPIRNYEKPGRCLAVAAKAPLPKIAKDAHRRAEMRHIFAKTGRDRGTIARIEIGVDFTAAGSHGLGFAILPARFFLPSGLTLDMSKNQLQKAPNFALSDRNTGAGQSAAAREGGRVTNPH